MEEREKWIATAALALVALVSLADVLSDLWAGSTVRHVVIESVVIATALAGTLVLWGRSLTGMRRAVRLSEHRMEQWRGEAERWRREAGQFLDGLGAAIDAEFERWGLTDAEKEVALLLLKGLSVREAAQVRGVSEKTVRHQSAAVYRKGGLKGRADLAAFFLEDLLLPTAPATPSAPSPSRDRETPGGP